MVSGLMPVGYNSVPYKGLPCGALNDFFLQSVLDMPLYTDAPIETYRPVVPPVYPNPVWLLHHDAQLHILEFTNSLFALYFMVHIHELAWSLLKPACTSCH